MATWLKYLLAVVHRLFPRRIRRHRLSICNPLTWFRRRDWTTLGMPTGVGLGWIHILPVDEDSHIVEKTGGGAGFSTYIAISQSRHIALFLAATDGSVDTHLNLSQCGEQALAGHSRAAAAASSSATPVKRVVRRRRVAKR